MTRAEVLTLINTNIVTNGNNEITAAVLNPVLSAIVNQINDLVGNPSNLPIGQTNVIEALNNITPQNIQIHTGTANPNDTPPSSFNVGDFYSQTLSSVIIAFWQFNGIEWVEILSRQEQKQRNVSTGTGNYNVLSTDDCVIYNAVSGGFTITMPDLVLNQEKIFTLVNRSNYNQTISSYNLLSSGSTTEFTANSVLKLISDGLNWYKINN